MARKAFTDPRYEADVARYKDAKCKPGQKVLKMPDGGGLYLYVTDKGARAWRFRYHKPGVNRKGQPAQIEQLLSLGTFTDTTLAQARAAAQAMREQLAAGVDPATARKADADADVAARANTFEVVTRAWLAKQAHWSSKYRGDMLARLERYAFPKIGRRAIGELESPDVLAVLEAIEAAGAVDSAHRMLPVFSRILRHAKGKGLCQHVVSLDISARDSLRKPIKHKRPAVKPDQLPALLHAIDSLENRRIRLGLQLVTLTFLRANEMLKATWDEFDFSPVSQDQQRGMLWRIPANRMKKRLPLLVPLVPQSVAILEELRAISCGNELVFPGKSYEKPLTSKALLGALDRLGYGGVQTTHGLRRLASTQINDACDEEGRPLWSSDAVERQLAHVPESVRATYNEAEYIVARRKLMAWWANKLDTLRAVDSGN